MTDKKTLYSNRELESLSIEDRIRYFESLREYVKSLSDEKGIRNPFQDIITKIYPLTRSYDYVLEGVKNIPLTGPVLFISNHSNSHDVFTYQEVCKSLGRRITSLGASDDINFATARLFKLLDGVLIDRRDKSSSEEGLLKFASHLANGQWGFILGESTWNLHPIKPMQDIKRGTALLGAITGVPIVPVNLEYIEVPKLCAKETELYEKCIVHFGKPLYIDPSHSLIAQTDEIQRILTDQRLASWENHGVARSSLGDINPELYCNHTWLKKFGALGFTFDSESEAKFLFSKDGHPVENEYHIDEYGNFVPGIIREEEGKRFVIQKK